MLCACAHGPDIKERIAPAIQAYYKFHDTRLVHFGLLHKKPTSVSPVHCRRYSTTRLDVDHGSSPAAVPRRNSSSGRSSTASNTT